eukprot:25827-Amphidinium_carterae.1
MQFAMFAEVFTYSHSCIIKSRLAELITRLIMMLTAAMMRTMSIHSRCRCIDYPNRVVDEYLRARHC